MVKLLSLCTSCPEEGAESSSSLSPGEKKGRANIEMWGSYSVHPLSRRGGRRVLPPSLLQRGGSEKRERGGKVTHSVHPFLKTRGLSPSSLCLGEDQR